MAIRTYKVTLDSKNSIAPEPVFLRQGDKTGAVVINATLMDNGAPVSLSGLTPTFKANTADGQAVIVDSTGFNIVNESAGEFTYQVPSQLGSVDGKIKIAYFSFSDSSGAQSTFNVVFVVEKAADMTQKSAKDWVSTLSEIIEKYNQWANDAHNSWEQFVNDNKEIIESIDPGGKVLSELIDFRHSDMLSKTFDTAKLRGDFWDQELASRGVNVKWFGAVGDGVADDTSAVNAAINYATNQGVTEVYLPTGSYRVTSSIILPDQFKLQGAGYSANNTGSTEIIKDGDFDAIWMKGGTSRVSGITVKGSVGNSGDGIWVTGSRVTLDEVEVTGQGGNGIRIGNKVASTNYNANLFDLSDVIITKCQDGLNIHDENNHDLPNAGAGTVYHLDVRECNRGLYINASIDTVLYNPVVQLCKTTNIYLDKFCKSAKFFGFYTEFSPTEVYIAEGARRNYIIAQRDNQPMDTIEDHGTQTFILGRDMQNNDKLAINKVQFNELEISNPKTSGRWSLSQDAVSRDLIIDMIGTSATNVGVRLNKGLYLGHSKINDYLATSLTVNFGAPKANAVFDINVNVAGIIKGSIINVSVKQPLPTGVILTSAASFSDGTVTLRAANLNNSDITIGNIVVAIGCFR